ncbi:NADPH:quinone reductase-like Zn-dependent oxidoreductase [Streptomyces pseudovenezuelae]|uniref:NADPH:quinone reductase-like Zn-dependent oxidoreductase n=2 Tax=Streptomyces pseudovenezuelae TaxID=67350 RepID=A0ABT6M4C6_9ACTN|nr:NADPH:quinone reductase-like Zn-dependent oxidoreductase [Streptomyces pseudovenezuelae]
MIHTDAWVLHAGPKDVDTEARPPGNLHREPYSFTAPDEREALVEPLYGSWEANIEHALSRRPVDVCRLRDEGAVVLGNLGIVRVLDAGKSSSLREGQICMVMPFAKRDTYGYAELIYAYDAPRTIGLLAQRTKIAADLLLPLPEDSRFSLRQWAAYARYFTAWDNWQVAYRCWSAQMRDQDPGEHLVFGWGGGVVLAELLLAKRAGFRVAMTASTDGRLAELAGLGITAVDRRLFPHLTHDPEHPPTDPAEVARYRTSEKEFLRTVDALSDGAGAAIFVDNIGAPLYKATVKSLARQGVVTTVGWKEGMRTFNLRASECINRHLHVNTHVWRYADCATIRDFQEDTAWIPSIDPAGIYEFDEVEQLAADYSTGKIDSYFPLYRVNQP